MPAGNNIIKRVGIALGSNLGDRRKNLEHAFDFLRELSADKKIVRSGILETEPVDCPPGSGLFLNAVAEINYTGTAHDLQKKLRAFEISMGRPNNSVKNAPRAIDLDILYFGSLQIAEPGLTIPHPRMLERQFVMQPLAEIRPELILPGQRDNVQILLERLT